jgi:hypothetical protein
LWIWVKRKSSSSHGRNWLWGRRGFCSLRSTRRRSPNSLGFCRRGSFV